jgi:hypothetical protein
MDQSEIALLSVQQLAFSKMERLLCRILLIGAIVTSGYGAPSDVSDA